jgi:hypothetical protein
VVYQGDAESLFVFFGLVVGVGVPVGVFYAITRRPVKKEFEAIGKHLGLNKEEIALLYRCARTLENPEEVFHNRCMFERCAGRLVKENVENIPIIVSIREKLRFRCHLPLDTTKDIELYQTGFVVYKGKMHDAVVLEKTEEELKIAILDRVSEVPQPGEQVKFSFFREDDGRYYFEAEVLNTYIECGKVILTVSHTEELGKIQPKKNFRTLPASLPAKA